MQPSWVNVRIIIRMSRLNVSHLGSHRASRQIGIARPVVPRELTRSNHRDDVRLGISLLGGNNRIRHVDTSVSRRERHIIVNVESAETCSTRVGIVVELLPQRLANVCGVVGRVVAVEVFRHGIATEIVIRFLSEAVCDIHVLDACIVVGSGHHSVFKRTAELLLGKVAVHFRQTHSITQTQRVGKGLPSVNVASEHRVAGKRAGTDVKRISSRLQLGKEQVVEVFLLVVLGLGVAGYVAKSCFGEGHIAVEVSKQCSYIHAEDT